jgi:hypothetical protein
MPTPCAVEPPTPDNIHLYRAAALAWRNSWRGEVQRHDGDRKLANPHAPLDAAAVAVQELAPEMTFEEAQTFAQKACAWGGQAHNRERRERWAAW